MSHGYILKISSSQILKNWKETVILILVIYLFIYKPRYLKIPHQHIINIKIISDTFYVIFFFFSYQVFKIWRVFHICSAPWSGLVTLPGLRSHMWLVATILDDPGLKDPKGTTGMTPLNTSIWHFTEVQAWPGCCLLSPIWVQSLFVRMLDSPYSLSSPGVGFCQELFPSLWVASIFHLSCLSWNATFSERSCRWHYPRSRPEISIITPYLLPS